MTRRIRPYHHRKTKISPVRRFLRGFVHAGRGFAVTLRTERNLRFHLAALAAVVVLGVWTGIDALRWAVVALAAGMVLAAELANTAVERLSDRVTKRRDPAIRFAKDAAAASVLAAAVSATAVGMIVLAPPFFRKLGF
jgi:diacylglycerol kinase